jgi:hypothetical protein
MDDDQRDEFLKHANIRDEIYLEWTTNMVTTETYKGYIGRLETFYVGVGETDTDPFLRIPLPKVTRYDLNDDNNKKLSISELEAISTSHQVEEIPIEN